MEAVGRRPLRTEFWWFKENSCMDIVTQQWRYGGGGIMELMGLQTNIKHQLQAWSKQKVSYMSLQIERERKYSDRLNDRGASNKELEEGYARLDKLLSIENDY